MQLRGYFKSRGNLMENIFNRVCKRTTQEKQNYLWYKNITFLHFFVVHSCRQCCATAPTTAVMKNG